ncbi:MAG: methyltransferase domain-containing protein [Acetobacteraceae bacterium]
MTGDVLELGTGWLPIIPLLFHLAGSRRLMLTDIERLMDGRAITTARAVILRYLPLVASTLGQSEAYLARRLGEEFTPDYVVPWDSRTHPANSADVIYSRAVLEHIPPPVLEQLLLDFHRILRPGGGMCHVIDNSDHWEHRDKTLSRVDFLRYEDGVYWKLATLDTQWYQNRLRHGDYLRLFRKFGWTADLAEGDPDEKCLRDLEALPLAAPFRGGDRRDLAVLTSIFVLRKAAAEAASGD